MAHNGYHNGDLIESNEMYDKDIASNEIDDNADIDDINEKNVIEVRIKRKAKRPSAKYANYFANGSIQLPIAEVDSSNGTVINSINKIPKKFTKNSRRPRGRFGRGLPKKGGAGGKGTWGSLGSELDGVDEGLEDPHDPNYDSDSQDNCKLDVITPPLEENEIDKHVTPIISEYFEHGDTEDVAISLEEINFGDNQYLVLVTTISLAMERKSSHREMASVLISDIYGRVIHEEDIERGFDVLLKSLPDLILDTPNAPIVLGNFIARAVADDCIPPKYVQAYKCTDDMSHARAAMDHASALLNMKHGLVRLDNVWGVTGGMRPVKYLVKKIQLIVREYLSSRDISEATQCLTELEVPHFHHEFVYEAVVMAIEDMREQIMDLICDLLKSLTSATVITFDQLKNGFTRVYEEMTDISIDVPLAYQVLEKIVHKGNSLGFIPQELVKNMPTRGRKRFVSEGDGGQLKE